jgi:magnesium transporter
MDHDGTGLGDAADTTSPTYNSGDMKSTEIAGESANSMMNDLVGAGPKVLPFEFKALEACLESACRCLESEVCGLSIGTAAIEFHHLNL